MGKIPSEHYWDKNNYKYPYQCKVVHMSTEDVDPRKVQEKVSFHFLRVPFNGEAHWGFETEANLNQFLVLIGKK